MDPRVKPGGDGRNQCPYLTEAHPETERSARSAGFALIAVLLVITVLSLIAANMLSTGRIAYALAHYSETRTRSAMLTEAGINRGILALLDQRPEHRWRVDGVPYTVNLSGTSVIVRIEDELGKIDLNAADRSLLTGLFASAGLDPSAADAQVDKVLDWRDGGTGAVKRLNGATDADYVAAAYSYRPRGGPFQRVDELLLVMGMTPELYRRVEPALTVYSGRPLFDPQVAPREALAALGQMDKAQIDTMMAARGTQTSFTSPGASPPPGTIDPAISTTGRAFTITADTIDSDSTSVATQAVIRLTGDPAQPYWVLSWRER
jgi:general secretion pathway protein K